MCSKDRQEVEALESKLYRAGIRSEIRSNPLADALGITRLEIYVHERDLHGASKVCQGLAAAGGVEDAPGDFRGTRGFNGFVEPEQSELVIEAKVIPSPATEPSRDGGPGRRPENDGADPDSDLAQATALLEKEVEALLVREGKLVNRCSSLEDRLKALDESLAHTQADLTREVSSRTAAEKKLAEVGEVRAALETELHALELRLKTSEQALAASQGRLDSQARELSVHQARIADFQKEVASRDAQLEKMTESLAQARAGMEQEKNLRQAAEQKAGELAAARKTLERQLAQQAQQREQLMKERREEHVQMQAYVGTVNDLRTRVRARLAAKEKH